MQKPSPSPSPSAYFTHSLEHLLANEEALKQRLMQNATDALVCKDYLSAECLLAEEAKLEAELVQAIAWTNQCCRLIVEASSGRLFPTTHGVQYPATFRPASFNN